MKHSLSCFPHRATKIWLLRRLRLESLRPVIEALKALTVIEESVKEEEVVQEPEPVQETRTVELTEHEIVINRFDAMEKKIDSLEELLIVLMADL